MTRKILLLLCIIFSAQIGLADSQNLGPIVQRQAKQIQELKNKLQELEKAVETLRAEFKESTALTNTNSNGASVTSINSSLGETDPSNLGKTKESPSTFFKNSDNETAQPNDKSEYDLALASLKEGKFEAAEKQFANFISNYPSSKLQSNATFWYAETFYRREMFNKAAINYLQSYKQFPKGAKASDALLKLSYSLAGLNKNVEACNILDKLENEFPERPISSIKRAREARSKFNCK
ncbi:MAG: tol-pal system protein YbgF [Rickettsiaceae bacterium]